MKKKVDPLTATDPISRALAAYQAQQESANPGPMPSQMESSVTNMARIHPPMNEATSSGPIRHPSTSSAPSMVRPPQYGAHGSCEQSNDSRSTSSAPPPPPYANLYTGRDKDPKRNGKVVQEQENGGGALSGQSRPGNSQPSQDVNSHSSRQSCGFSGWSSGQSLGYSSGFSGVPVSVAADPSQSLGNHCLSSLQVPGPLSTMELARLPSFSNSFPLVCPSSDSNPSSQGYSSMAVSVTLSGLDSLFPSNNVSLAAPLSNMHPMAPLHSRGASNGGETMAMTGPMQQVFECFVSQLPRPEPGAASTAAPATCETQEEEPRKLEVAEYQDELLRAANQAVNDYHLQTPMLTDVDLGDREDMDGAMGLDVDGPVL